MTDFLRETAAMMRAAAEAAPRGPWSGRAMLSGYSGSSRFSAWEVGPQSCPRMAIGVAGTDALDGDGLAVAQATATHIAAWHPAVALAVADWLDREVEWLETTLRHKHAEPVGACSDAFAVARAWRTGLSDPD